MIDKVFIYRNMQKKFGLRGRLGIAKAHIVVFAQLGNYKPGFAGPPNFILDYDR